MLVLLGALAAAGAVVAAVRLRATAAADTLVGRSSPSYVATRRYQQRFGDDAVIVLVREPLTSLVLSADIGRLLGLEGCLSGNVPAGVVPHGGVGGPCAAIGRAHDTQIVFGPATFINEAAGEIDDQLSAQVASERTREQQVSAAAYAVARGRGYTVAGARAAAGAAVSAVRLDFIRTLLPLAQQYNLITPPSLNDPDFVRALVFDPTRPLGTPKARFSSLFPAHDAAVVQVRLRAGLSDAAKARAIGLIRAAVAMPDWRLGHGGSYAVTGVPVIVSDLSGAVVGSLLRLLAVAVVAMALALLVVSRRGGRRLVPLGVALACAGLTFGGLAVSGARLTMATVGVLPVLIGLAVDYAIQFQSRAAEFAGVAAAGARTGVGAGAGAGVGAGAGAGGGVRAEAVRRAVTAGGPTIVAAAAASAGGFVVLALPVVGSPVPMVRSFGLLLVVGVCVALMCALAGGSAAQLAVLATRRGGGRLRAALAPSLRGAQAIVGGALAGARRQRGSKPPRRTLLLSGVGSTRDAGAAMVGGGRRVVGRGSAWARGAALAHPWRVLGAGALCAVLGFGLGTQTPVESDIQQLVPQGLPALRALGLLERSTHVGGEIDVLVSGEDLTTPSVVSWMTAYQQRIERRFGYTGTAGCGQAVLCPAFSLPDLFSTVGSHPSAADIHGLLAAVPPYFSREVITPDRRAATLAFGIRLMALAAQERVIAAMRAELHPPAGVQATLVGLPVLAADANAAIASSWRRLLTLIAGLAAVGLVLAAALRSIRRAVVPLVPIVLASGWSALVLFAVRVPLNPMSVTLGALVVAIATEFSVLLAERYRQERAGGATPPARALARTYDSTGRAVLASAATAIAGFAVLVASDIRMLRDFGLVTVIDLTVTLAGVLLVLPSVLVLAERDRLSLGFGRRRRAASTAGGWLRARGKPPVPVEPEA